MNNNIEYLIGKIYKNRERIIQLKHLLYEPVLTISAGNNAIEFKDVSLQWYLKEEIKDLEAKHIEMYNYLKIAMED